MTFKQLSTYFEKIEATASRLEMTEILADLFKKIDQENIDKVLYLLQGSVVPMYQKVDFGLAEKMLTKGITQALDIEKKVFKNRLHQIGDLGKTTEEFRKKAKKIKEKNLDIATVFSRLEKIAQASGKGSQEVKLSHLADLVRELDCLSCRYLVRIPTNTWRLGFSDMTILDAFSWMIKGDKSLRGKIEQAYHVRPDLGLIGKKLKKKGILGLAKIEAEVFTPILMMKAERLSSSFEIVKKIGRCSIEPKYDGFRLQVHFKSGEVKLFSRNLDDITYMYPDLVYGIKKQVKAKEVIFEGEAIGYDPQTEDFLPFQETVQRKRKYGIEEKAEEIPLKLFCFDILFLNGKKLLETEFRKRREILTRTIKTTKDTTTDTLILAEDKITDQPKELDFLFEEAVSKGLEGIVAKKLGGKYMAGAREWNWIKYKRSYSAKLQDTIDCLVLGYDFGRGRRADFGIGAFLVGIYDKREDKYLTVAKIGTGLSDQDWCQLKKKCDQFKSANQPAIYQVDKQAKPNVWVKPEIVVEIRADEITRSSVHTAGRVMKPTKTGKAKEVATAGFALRFPRLDKFRDDKRPEEVTTLGELGKMYRQQKA